MIPPNRPMIKHPHLPQSALRAPYASYGAAIRAAVFASQPEPVELVSVRKSKRRSLVP